MRLLTKILLIAFSLNVNLLYGQTDAQTMVQVKNNLAMAGSNRGELERVIKHFKRDSNPLKLQATYFLIANMDIHYSADYYWADNTGKKVTYDELSYNDFRNAIKALNRIRDSTTIHQVPIISKDLETIKSDFLIDNINLAFDTWKSSSNQISFADFCNFILPYRVTTEPLQNWRKKYLTRYKWLSDSLKNTTSIIKTFSLLKEDYDSNFHFPNEWETLQEPLLKSGPSTLLFRKHKGECTNATTLEVFALRSQGIPASYNMITLWGSSTGSHTANTILYPGEKPIQIDVTRPQPINQRLEREPAKVIRITYEKQPNNPATIEQPQNIPSGFMQTKNYVDITDEYWSTDSLGFKLEPENAEAKITYACVYNGGNWRPAWWGINRKQHVNFLNMPVGIIILPIQYKEGKFKPVGFPKIVGDKSGKELIPNHGNKIAIRIMQQEKYLIFRPGSKYTLYYWDHEWKRVETKSAEPGIKELFFENVPANALYILIPEYSIGKERPFIIQANGARSWL